MLRLGRAFLLLNNCFTSTFAIALKSAVKSCTVCCQIFMLRKQSCQLLVSCCHFSGSDLCASAVCQQVSSVYRLRKNFLLLSLQDVYSYYLEKKKWNHPSWGVTKHTRVRPDMWFFTRREKPFDSTLGGKKAIPQVTCITWTYCWYVNHYQAGTCVSSWKTLTAIIQYYDCHTDGSEN